MSLPSQSNFESGRTCKNEFIPSASGEADILFRYARWLQKNNQLKRDISVYAEIERLYRISAQHMHYKANINLQNGSLSGHFKVRNWEHLRLSEHLIDGGIATGYLFIAHFLEQGSAGLQKDNEMAQRYYRKAADEGNAQAQYYVADKFDRARKNLELVTQMYRCAAAQGHGKSAIMLSIILRNELDYSGALETLQMGVAGGDENSAWRLYNAFINHSDKDAHYLGQSEDTERAKRYYIIMDLLSKYSYAAPNVGEINNIVPLPPAALPPWDGKLQWVEERRANVPPEKPSEALIHKLAKEKLLDPTTGRPLPGSPAFSQTDFPLMTCLSGDACPATGYWKRFTNGPQDHIQHFQEGDIMPNYKFSWTKPRIWPFADELIQRAEVVEWGFIG